MSGMKILCVENRPEDMAALAHMLKEIGCEVMPAIDGGEALDLFSKQAVDGVLLEYNLPDATGTEIRERLKSIRPDIPVLLFAGVGTQTPFMLHFFDEYLRKRETFADVLMEDA